MRLTLLGRPGCHLCEQMVEQLLSTFPGQRWQIEEFDVDSREDWRRRYGLKIPVLLDPAGSAVCVSQFDANAVAEWISDQRKSAE